MRLLKRFFIAVSVRLCECAHKLIATLPTEMVLSISASVGSLIFRFCSREERTALAQLRYALPHLSDELQRKLPHDAFHHMGQCVGEALICHRFVNSNSSSGRSARAARKESITGDGEHPIAAIRESRKGAVGLSAHLGSFELLAAYLADSGLQCTVLGRSPNYASIKHIINRVRRSYGVEVIWTDAPGARRYMLSAAQNGKVICALIDQDTRWKSGFAPFFGLAAASPLAPIRLAMRYRLPLFTSFIVRASRFHHHVTTEALPYSGDDPAAARKILTLYNGRLEKLVREHPEQYLWWHRRWRRRPGIDYLRSPEKLRGHIAYTEWLNDLAGAPTPRDLPASRTQDNSELAERSGTR